MWDSRLAVRLGQDPQLSGASIKSEQNRRFESRRESEGQCQDGVIGREEGNS